MSKTRHEFEQRVSTSLSADTQKTADHPSSQISQADYDVIVAHHRFLWNDKDAESKNWKDQLAKKYSDKLFKEFCISDLSGYKTSGLALRWRTQKELLSGKGENSCADKNCSESSHLKTWEVPFVYSEHGEQKSALVKLKLCQGCSTKLTYYFSKKKPKSLSVKVEDKEKTPEQIPTFEDSTIWDNLLPSSSSDKIQDYLDDLFL